MAWWAPQWSFKVCMICGGDSADMQTVSIYRVAGEAQLRSRLASTLVPTWRLSCSLPLCAYHVIAYNTGDIES
jgi:hypothetical protein